MTKCCLFIASFGRGRLLWLTMFFFLFVNPFQGKSQSTSNLLDTLITINFNNQRLKDALEQMEIQTHITFSYKSGLLKEDRIINQYFANESLERIIVKLIDDETISFNNLGRQIYFYIPKNTKFVPIKKEVVKRVEVPVYKEILKTDTILLTRVDTVFFTNTVKDTVLIKDSIFIENNNAKAKFSFSTFLNQSVTIPGYKLNDQSYANLFEDLKQAESNGSSTRFGVLGALHFNNYSISSGLGVSVLRNHADYHFTSIITDSATVIGHESSINSIRYFYTDSFTITITNPDGSEQLIVSYPEDSKDSIVTYDVTYLHKKDTVQFDYEGSNRFTYLTLPFYFAWEKAINDKSNVFVNAGVIVDFLVSTKGKTLSDSPYKELVPLASLPLSPVNATFSLGLGYTYHLQNRWHIYGRMNYDFQVNSLYSKIYPIRKKPQTIGLTVGLWFR